MAKYIKCSRTSGLVMSERLFDNPQKLGNTNTFWVRVQESAAGSQPAWRTHCPKDRLKFQTYQSLPSGSTEAVIVNEAQGQWQHSVSAMAARDYLQKEARLQRDRETYLQIRDWCEREPEGCEEAFMNQGIKDPQNPRYQAYLTAVEQIKSLRGQG